MGRARWFVLLLPLAVVIAATAVAIWVVDDDAWGRGDRPGIPEADPIGTAGELPGQVPATVGTPIGELFDIGQPRELTHLIGRRVQLVIDVKQAMNDVAFWTGTPPDDLLVVLARGTRTDIERQLGRPSGAPFGAVSGGEYITVSGTIEPVPADPEAMFSWRLTRRDAALLDERGVYVHVDSVVTRAPSVSMPPEDIEEWGRETAPPPGEAVDTEPSPTP